ncbi:hypothetical protein [Oceanobacillus manasiensis]|uniref:hypothetical protein n=1 Tax=Oceanobacillus manasiensis TaxID=586413 RepID=UPI0005A690F2|nr:hypothetical protein [Oceanobacillus manasiensis]
MKLLQSKGERIFYLIYITLMLVSYLGYVALDNYRVTTRGSGSITGEEAQSIAQIGMWTSNVELIFIVLFVIVMIVMYLRAFKKKEVIKLFIIMNSVLFAGIIVLSFILLLVTSLPIGNLLQPLFFPVFLLVILLPFVKLMNKKKEQSF